MACDWIAERPEDRTISAGKMVAILTERVLHPSHNLNCKSEQARLATLWGYVKSQPAAQPEPESDLYRRVLKDGLRAHSDEVFNALRKANAQRQPAKPVAIVKIIGHGKDYRPCQHETGEWREEDGVCVEFADGNRECFYVSDLLYTTQPQPAKPLANEQIEYMRGEANRGYNIDLDEYTKAVRDTEAAHGITGEKS